jgi:citrate lyase subunit gamma (acyl carrier protein)
MKNSDAHVSVEIGGQGIRVEIISKIKSLFGKHMECAVRDACADIGVENAEIIVQDFGALDFIIKARVKTALKRARRQVENA